MSEDNDASEVEVKSGRETGSDAAGGEEAGGSLGGRRSSLGGGRGGFKKRHGEHHHQQQGKGKKRFRDEFVYPTGGNLHDPLNLSTVTSDTVEPPMKQPRDAPLRVKIPGTRSDPLNLLADVPMHVEEPVDDSIVSPMPRGNFSKNNKKKAETSKEDDKEEDASKREAREAQARKEKKEAFNKKYQYGNFDRYYGHRLVSGQKDTRLSVLKREWFERRAVLDIGCNAGFLTLSIAKEYNPRRILGIDIDEHLIGVARKNIRHYCDKDIELSGKFPASFARQFGPLSATPLSFSTKFPDNIWFRTENFVLDNEELLETVTEEYDVILALSITKWIHLNWGDEGMRRFFKRCFRSLLPGGRLILEPQDFSTYRKRSVMSDTLRANYRTIEFKPEDFEMYLLEACGFERVEHLCVTGEKAKGFERPVDMYVKAPPEFMTRKDKRKKKKEEETKGEEKKEENGKKEEVVGEDSEKEVKVDAEEKEERTSNGKKEEPISE